MSIGGLFTHAKAQIFTLGTAHTGSAKKSALRKAIATLDKIMDTFSDVSAHSRKLELQAIIRDIVCGIDSLDGSDYAALTKEIDSKLSHHFSGPRGIIASALKEIQESSPLAQHILGVPGDGSATRDAAARSAVRVDSMPLPSREPGGHATLEDDDDDETGPAAAPASAAASAAVAPAGSEERPGEFEILTPLLRRDRIQGELAKGAIKHIYEPGNEMFLEMMRDLIAISKNIVTVPFSAKAQNILSYLALKMAVDAAAEAAAEDVPITNAVATSCGVPVHFDRYKDENPNQFIRNFLDTINTSYIKSRDQGDLRAFFINIKSSLCLGERFKQIQDYLIEISKSEAECEEKVDYSGVDHEIVAADICERGALTRYEASLSDGDDGSKEGFRDFLIESERIFETGITREALENVLDYMEDPLYLF